MVRYSSFLSLATSLPIGSLIGIHGMARYSSVSRSESSIATNPTAAALHSGKDLVRSSLFNARTLEDVIGIHDVIGLKPGHLCGVISVVAEFMVNVTGLKPGHLCDAISVVAESMVDVTGLKPGHLCDVISVVAEFMVNVAGLKPNHWTRVI
jgi:hypothetical protein